MSASIDTGNFDLLNPNITTHEEEPHLAENMERQCSISSNGSIDLQGQYVSNDILVALLDRPNEMRDLATRNNQFYEALQHYITETQGETSWRKFENILYKSREKLPDRVWMNSISHFLAHNPVFLSKFKETVGWEEESDRSYLSTTPITSHHHHNYHKQSHGNGSRRRSRRLSNMSLEDVLEQEDDILYEEAAAIPDGMFSSEHQFYQQPTARRHSSSCHLVQSEPHPTFVDSTIDELDEAEIVDNYSEIDESDHLEDLLEEDDDESDQEEQNISGKDKNVHHQHHRLSDTRTRDKTQLLKLRDDPYFQSRLATTHAFFFRKAKQLLAISPSSSRFIATNRRNSILEDVIPGSPVTELDEPRFQTCFGEETNHGDLTKLICCTRQKQHDDALWLEQVMDALGDWPELIDSLHDIVDESIGNNDNHF